MTQKSRAVVLCHQNHQSIQQTQLAFRREFNVSPPTRPTLCKWIVRFEERRAIENGKSSGRPPVTEEDIELIREVFSKSPKKSIRRASLELDIPRTSFHIVLCKKLNKKPYKTQKSARRKQEGVTLASK